MKNFIELHAVSGRDPQLFLVNVDAITSIFTSTDSYVAVNIVDMPNAIPVSEDYTTICMLIDQAQK